MCATGDAEGLLHHELRSFWACLYQQLVRLSKRLVVADFSQLDDGARGIVEMLFCTSLIALVGAAINHNLAHGSCRLSIQK